MVAGGSCGRRTSPPTPSPAERGAAGEKMSASGLWTLAPLSCGRGAGGEVRGAWREPHRRRERGRWVNDVAPGASSRHLVISSSRHLAIASSYRSTSRSVPHMFSNHISLCCL
jgi:hypothetical protein